MTWELKLKFRLVEKNGRFITETVITIITVWKISDYKVTRKYILTICLPRISGKNLKEHILVRLFKLLHI